MLGIEHGETGFLPRSVPRLNVVSGFLSCFTNHLLHSFHITALHGFHIRGVSVRIQHLSLIKNGILHRVRKIHRPNFKRRQLLFKIGSRSLHAVNRTLNKCSLVAVVLSGKFFLCFFEMALYFLKFEFLQCALSFINAAVVDIRCADSRTPLLAVLAQEFRDLLVVLDTVCFGKRFAPSLGLNLRRSPADGVVAFLCRHTEKPLHNVLVVGVTERSVGSIACALFLESLYAFLCFPHFLLRILCLVSEPIEFFLANVFGVLSEFAAADVLGEGSVCFGIICSQFVVRRFGVLILRCCISFFAPLVMPVGLNLLNEEHFLAVRCGNILNTRVSEYALCVITPMHPHVRVGVGSIRNSEDKLSVV